MTQQDAAVAADELKRFCQQLVFHGQFRSMRRFTAGSSAEIVDCMSSMRECGLSTDAEDVDRMYYSIELYAFPLTQPVPVEYNGIVLRIHTDDLHPGYARLIPQSFATANADRNRDINVT